MNKCCSISSETVKKYDPMPKNKDGSIKWFLYRWDDGKNGYRKLVRCRECGGLYIVQSYRLNKFSANADVQYEDWYAVNDEAQTDLLNQKYTGVQLEHKLDMVYRTCE
ncbi:MAG: hypothetical protein IJZ72_03695 [Oscillospiraceae bacterium]|nr:hypothetical protein [Oscillospiraceae bacterium]